MLLTYPTPLATNVHHNIAVLDQPLMHRNVHIEQHAQQHCMLLSLKFYTPMQPKQHSDVPMEQSIAH